LATEIPFNRNFEVNYGEIENVAPGIRRITANNPSPFTFRGTGTYILGEGNVAVIDPGPDQPEHVRAIVEFSKFGQKNLLLRFAKLNKI